MENSVSRSLTDLPIGASGQVVAVGAGSRQLPDEVARRLAEIGFLPGERVRIVARNAFSGADCCPRRHRDFRIAKIRGGLREDRARPPRRVMYVGVNALF
jgi:Fe2+ transport system protein FeoA